eukprot:TRINITY_DN45920_c0_g1_i1.p1 TRINITY_DN45920_c0_g1~~TRINITY_DN45920_c0_g1_i1.p1  ORF type:complete len:529 (-),score=106.22 TRINITY_DN45920_c0_g1_i1:231-1817(-)
MQFQQVLVDCSAQLQRGLEASIASLSASYEKDIDILRRENASLQSELAALRVSQQIRASAQAEKGLWARAKVAQTSLFESAMVPVEVTSEDGSHGSFTVHGAVLERVPLFQAWRARWNQGEPLKEHCRIDVFRVILQRLYALHPWTPTQWNKACAGSVDAAIGVALLADKWLLPDIASEAAAAAKCIEHHSISDDAKDEHLCPPWLGFKWPDEEKLPLSRFNEFAGFGGRDELALIIPGPKLEEIVFEAACGLNLEMATHVCVQQKAFGKAYDCCSALTEVVKKDEIFTCKSINTTHCLNNRGGLYEFRSKKGSEWLFQMLFDYTAELPGRVADAAEALECLVQDKILFRHEFPVFLEGSALQSVRHEYARLLSRAASLLQSHAFSMDEFMRIFACGTTMDEGGKTVNALCFAGCSYDYGHRDYGKWAEAEEILEGLFLLNIDGLNVRMLERLLGLLEWTFDRLPISNHLAQHIAERQDLLSSAEQMAKQRITSWENKEAQGLFSFRPEAAMHLLRLLESVNPELPKS